MGRLEVSAGGTELHIMGVQDDAVETEAAAGVLTMPSVSSAPSRYAHGDFPRAWNSWFSWLYEQYCSVAAATEVFRPWTWRTKPPPPRVSIAHRFFAKLSRGRRSERRGILPALVNRPVARDFLAVERIRGSLCARERRRASGPGRRREPRAGAGARRRAKKPRRGDPEID